MKKGIIIVLAVLLVALAVWGYMKSTVAGNAVEGTIVSVSNEQVMFDGPSVIVIKTDAGKEETIHVPSMGINLCKAKDAIANPYELKAGQRVAVNGTRVAETGAILPCESADHYLKVI